MNILASVSGGRSSAVMLHTLLTNDKYKDANILACFANTGLEKEQTLIFVRDIEKAMGVKVHWLEAVFSYNKNVGPAPMLVNYKKASRYGQPFEAMVDTIWHKNENATSPNKNAPYCSSRLKSIIIHKFAKEYFNGESYKTALGFRREDMPKRISWPEIKADHTRIFPLITDYKIPLDQKQVHTVLLDLGIDLGISSKRGNCELCWRKSRKNLIHTVNQKDSRVQFVRDLGIKYGNMFLPKPIDNKTGFVSIDDIIQDAKIPRTLDIFDEQGGSCACSGF